MTSLKTSIKTITYLSDIGCLEIQGASLRGGTTRQPISVPTGACSRQPLPLAQGQQLPTSASTGLAIMNATEAKCLFNGV